jgi:hypothetical protein
VFAVAFLMGGAGVQDTLLLCRMESALHRVCCCKHPPADALAQGHRPAHDTPDELSRRPCCDEVSWAAAAIPPSYSAAGAAFVAPSLLEQRMPAARALFAHARVDVPAPMRDVREATGPPIPIKHRALLI